MDETSVLDTSTISKIYINNLILETKDNYNTLNDIILSYNPSEDIRKLIKDLMIALESLLIKLNDLMDRVESQGSNIFIENYIKSYSSLIKEFHRLYEFLQFSGLQNVPYSILYFTEYLTNLIDEENIFTLIPTYQNTFRFIEISGFLQQIFRYSISNPETIFPPNKKFSILMYPFAFKNMLFSNILLAHEIGHFIDLRREMGNKLSRNIQYNNERISEIASNHISRQFPEIEEPTKIRNWDLIFNKTKIDMTKYLNNWFTELACDLIAFKLMGPCYIISIVDFILSGTKILQGSEKHPPPLLRLNLLMKEFNDSTYEDKFKRSNNSVLNKYAVLMNTISNNFSDIIISSESLRPEPIDPDCLGEKMMYTYEIILDKFSEIQKEVNEISKSLGCIYEPETLIEEINPLIESIDQLIVPCEINRGKPANPISVLNCGVIYNLILLDELYSKNSLKIEINKSEFKFQINMLIKKGLELCLIQKMCLPYIDQ